MTKQDYKDMLLKCTDEELVRETEHKVWLSAYAANNSKSDYHWQTDFCYSEANWRNKPWLYQQGWNAAFESAGYDISEDDKNRAKAQTN